MKYFRIILKLFVIGLGLSLIACSQTIKLLDKQFNRVKAEPPLFCSNDNPCQEARNFHKTLFIADLHADSLLLGRDLIEKSDEGLVDIPRLIKGNVAIQVFGVVTKYSVQDIQSSGSTVSRNPSKINDGCDYDLITLRAKFPDWPKDTEKSLMEIVGNLAEELKKFVNVTALLMYSSPSLVPSRHSIAKISIKIT